MGNDGSKILEAKWMLTMHVRCQEPCLDKSQGEKDYKNELFKYILNLICPNSI